MVFRTGIFSPCQVGSVGELIWRHWLSRISAVVLLDEPSNHLDPRHQVTLLGGMIDEWRRARRTVVMVLHDINLAMRFSDHLVFLYGDGKASHGLVAEMATEGHFSSLYDQPMGRYQANDHDLFFPL